MASMAGAATFDPAFAQNVQTMNEQFFDNLLVMGVTAISTVKGCQIVRYAYNTARKFWQSEAAQPPTPEPAEDSE